MKAHSFILRLLGSIMALCLFSTADAGSPLWTLIPLTATTLSVPSNDTATVQYTVINQSTRVHTLSMQSIQGISQLTTGLGVCGNPFILTGKAFCTLSLQIDGSQLTQPISDGPIVCEQGSTLQCYRPASANILAITQSAAITDVTLSGVSPSSGAASGGTGVTLTGVGLAGATGVTFGGSAATSVNVVNSTTVTAVTPAHAAGAVDVVITTPSGSATATNGYTYLATTVGQSAYGGTIACLNGGLNNLIAATTDNSSGIPWGGGGTDITSAESTTDGQTNTTNIVAVLGGEATYAAGLCSNYAVDSLGNTPCQSGNTCYSDWFLPAGNNTSLSGQLNCLFTNQILIGGFYPQSYWSSNNLNPGNAEIQGFVYGDQDNVAKNFDQRVRCVRAFTP